MPSNAPLNKNNATTYFVTKVIKISALRPKCQTLVESISSFVVTTEKDN
jgi:hypothetical protein